MDREKLINFMIEKYEEDIMILQGCISTLNMEKFKLRVKEIKDAKEQLKEGERQ